MNYYPPEKEKSRIEKYKYYEMLFKNEHFNAFNVKIQNQLLKEFEKLRYIACDYPSMISKLSADMLFEEFPKVSLESGESDSFIEAIIRTNNFKAQIYENALENSFRGDGVFKIRAEDSQMIIEDINPSCYFPRYDEMNVRGEPSYIDLMWKIRDEEESKDYVFREKHNKGSIENFFYFKEDGGKLIEVDLKKYTELTGKEVERIVKTNIDDFLVVHIKNVGINTDFFGLSDYVGLISLFYAINNRVSKIDNILDKHGSPVLAVPEGVLDDEGNVKRDAFGLIEVPTDEASGMKPEYIVWDAKLESAFSQIDRIVEMIFLFSETSTALFGKDKEGRAESGRALKFRLLRTLAKKHRKQLYYDYGLKRLFYIAQDFAYSNKLEIGGEKQKRKPKEVQIEWEDGIVNDLMEQLEAEQIKLDNNLTTAIEAIMRIENISRSEAEKKAKEINKIKEEQKPDFSIFNKVNNANEDSDRGRA